MRIIAYAYTKPLVAKAEASGSRQCELHSKTLSTNRTREKRKNHSNSIETSSLALIFMCNLIFLGVFFLKFFYLFVLLKHVFHILNERYSKELTVGFRNIR